MIENSSILQDEMIAHRLGLVPLKTDLDNYNLPEDCECQSEFGCSQCRVTLTLNAESPESTRTVYSGKLVSENPDVMPVSDKIPLVKLGKGQKLKLEAYARLGKGKSTQNGSLSANVPTSITQRLKFPPKNARTARNAFDICPKKVLTIKGDKIDVRDLLACNLCMDCVEICPKKDQGIKVEWEKNDFIMTVESTGALPPERVLQEATKMLDKQLNEFEEQLKVEVQ
jgi:DNA-directed RNA polymerase subunit D